MGRFFERYLPASERRVALWLAFGGAGVTVAAARVGSLVRESSETAFMEAGSTPEWTPALIAAVVQLSLVAVLIAVLMRFGRAPRVLALYLALGAGASFALSVLGLPFAYLGQKAMVASLPLDVVSPGLGGWWIPSAREALDAFAQGTGAIAGAWIATTVSLARIRDAGFSGDDPEGRGLRAKPEAIGWGFVGWEGRPASGGALVALAFVAVELLVGIAGILINAVYLLVPGGLEAERGASAFALGFSAGLALAWLLAARTVARRSGVASLWLLPAVGMLQTLWFAAQGGLTRATGSSGRTILLTTVAGVAAPLAILAAALVGTELGLRARPATLSDTPDPQDPGAGPLAPADTAGG